MRGCAPGSHRVARSPRRRATLRRPATSGSSPRPASSASAPAEELRRERELVRQPLLLRLVERERADDDCEVRERLRKVTELLAGGRQLLREESDIVRAREHARETLL